MKIIHCADIHIGIKRGPLDPETKMPGRVVDVLESFDIMLDFTEEENVDALLIAGDVFHTSDPNPMMLNAVASRIKRAAAICPVVILVGNHDTPGPIHRRTSIDIFGELQLDNVYLGNNFETIVINTKSGPLQVTAFPYPTRHLVSAGNLISWNDYQDAVKHKLEDARRDVDPTIPAVFLGHFTVSGSVFGSEQPMIFGNDAEVSMFDLFEEDQSTCPWDYIALGHLHHHQEVFDNPPIVYAGSLDRVDFGEENDDKGFIIVTIEDTVSWEFISVDSRPMVTINIDTFDRKHIRTFVYSVISKTNIQDAVVRVIIRTDNAAHISGDEITKMLYEAGAYWVTSVKVDVPVETTVRWNLDKPPAAFSQTELLEIYLDVDELDDDEFNALLDLAEEIMTTGDG